MTEVLVNQPSSEPTRKVRLGAAGGVSGAPITVILLWILGAVGLEVTPEVAGAIGAIVSTITYFAVAYITKARKTDVEG